MRQAYLKGAATGLILGVITSVVAEEIKLVTYYPAPRGVYEELRTTGTTTLATQAGSVGIGTANPEAKLMISGGDLYIDVSSAARKLGFRVSAGNIPGYLDYETATNIVNLVSANAIRMKAGTVTLAQFVNGGTDPASNSFFSSIATSNVVGVQGAGSHTAAYQLWRDASGNHLARLIPMGAADQRLQFQLYHTLEGAPTNYERLNIYPDSANSVFRIDSEIGGTGTRRNLVLQGAGGNVGIGTPIPARTLHINDTMRLQPRATPPASPAAGDLYVDSTPPRDELCFHDGTSWQGISSGTDTNCI